MKITITDIQPGLRFTLPTHRPDKYFEITHAHNPSTPNQAVLVKEVGKRGVLVGKNKMYPISWLLQDGVQ